MHKNPKIQTLALEGEDPESLYELPNEEVLIRWVNFHLKEAGSERFIANFGPDMRVR
jgi:plastin-1